MWCSEANRRAEELEITLEFKQQHIEKLKKTVAELEKRLIHKDKEYEIKNSRAHLLEKTLEEKQQAIDELQQYVAEFSEKVALKEKEVEAESRKAYDLEMKFQVEQQTVEKLQEELAGISQDLFNKEKELETVNKFFSYSKQSHETFISFMTLFLLLFIAVCVIYVIDRMLRWKSSPPDFPEQVQPRKREAIEAKSNKKEQPDKIIEAIPDLRRVFDIIAQENQKPKMQQLKSTEQRDSQQHVAQEENTQRPTLTSSSSSSSSEIASHQQKQDCEHVDPEMDSLQLSPSSDCSKNFMGFDDILKGFVNKEHKEECF